MTLAELDAAEHLETAGEDEAHEHLDAVELDGQGEDEVQDAHHLDAAGLAFLCLAAVSSTRPARPRGARPARRSR